MRARRWRAGAEDGPADVEAGVGDGGVLEVDEECVAVLVVDEGVGGRGVAVDEDRVGPGLSGRRGEGVDEPGQLGGGCCGQGPGGKQ